MPAIIELYQLLGCDMSIAPTTNLEFAVLALKFLAVTGFLFLGAKYLFKLLCGMWRG